jgi:hypothetical protein
VTGTDDRPGAATWLTLLALCAGGFTLRLIGLSYGLPDVFNPDEVAIMNRALAFATGDLNPKNFLYPTFYFYALFAWEALFFVAGWTIGLFESAARFETTFFTDPTSIFLAGRALSALAGTATIWAVYALGRRAYERSIGLIAAAFMTVAPIAVRDAHYVKHDVPVTLLIVLAHVAIARLLVDPEYRAARRGWIVAGLLTGLAMSTHYYAVFLVIPLIAVAFVDVTHGPQIPRGLRIPRRAVSIEPRALRPAFRGLITALAVAAIAFLAASPFILMEPSAVIRDVVANRHIVVDRAMAAGGGLFPSPSRYIDLLQSDALGKPVFVAAVAGLVMAMLTDWRRALMLVGFTVPFLLFISNTYPASRYLNPVLPFLAMAAAMPVAWAARLSKSYATALAVLSTAALAAPALSASITTGVFFRQSDTRTLAREFIEREIPTEATVLVQPYSVALRQSRDGLIEALRHHLGTETAATTKFQRQLALQPYPSPAYRTIFLGDGGLDKDKIYVSLAAVADPAPLDALRAHQVQYVVLKRYNADTSLDGLVTALAREGRLLATFTPYAAGNGGVEPFLHNTDARIDSRLARPGPAIEVWKIDR